MSASQLGKRLLEEVEEGSLDELLSEIRESTPAAQKSHLGIPALDQILEVFRRPRLPPSRPAWASPQESSDDGEDYYGDLNTPSRPHVWATRFDARPLGRVIQLNSDASATGTTSLLCFLSASSILPKHHGGNEATAIWLDTDGRFSALRLAQIYDRILKPHTGKSNLDAEIREGLSHVHVLRPQSSAQLLVILRALPSYLLSRTQHHSQQRPLGLVVLDSATAFYWADRADAEVARLSDPVAVVPPSTTSQVIAELRGIEQSFGCAIFFSTDASVQRKNRGGPNTDIMARTVADSPVPPQREQVYLDPWTNFATLTFEVHRVAVPQFAPAMTVEECAREQPKRIEAVRRGRHRAQLVWSGNEGNKVREDVRKLQNGEGFGFSVTALGVDVEPA